MNEIYITVYVLNKNYSQYILQCIESLLIQTNKNFELIVIDNCSDDNSQEIIKNNFPSLNLICLEKSIRLTEVGNMVANIAKGSHFVRLDADDWVTVDFVEKFYEKLKVNSSLSAIFPNYHEVNVDGHITKTVKRFDFDSEVSLFDLPAHGACTLLSKKAFYEVGGYDGTLDRQDGYDLWLKIIKNHKVSNLEEALFFYRQHDNNLTKSQKKLLEVRTNILFKHAVKNGLNLDDYLFIIPIQKSDDFFGQLSSIKLDKTTILNLLIKKIYDISENANICISSESAREYFDLDDKILFCQRTNNNQSLKESICEVDDMITSTQGKDYKYIVTLTIDYPLLDAHYILSAISYINYFETDSVDSVCIEDSLLFQHNGDSLKPAYNNTVTRFERDTLYKKSGGINIIRISKLNEYDGISTKKSGHIIIDKLSALRADNIEIINFIKEKSI